MSHISSASSSRRWTYKEIATIFKLSQENDVRESLVYDMDKDIDDAIVLANVSWKVLKRKCRVGRLKRDETFLWNKHS